MAKNILLLFLSPVKPNDNTKYLNLEGEGTKGTSESAVRYLLKKCSLDKIFIIESKMIRNPIENYFEDGKPVTHLDFFKTRIEKFLPNADYVDFPYDEQSTGVENLKSVAEISREIQAYAAQFKEEEIILHVDLTGGRRDVNMVMLDLTRLLEYSCLKIGSLIYSNYNFDGTKTGRVEELKNIYDLFQLIAGVEEFVNFGSVMALDNYYKGKNLSEPLQKLLAAMKNFAEAIKLCHYWQFKAAIENLHDAVRDFEPSPENVEDILMARLIERIREDYHKLIVNRVVVDDIEIIHWCLEHDYLQQALTLYTERLPEYLGKEKIITQSATEEKSLLERVKKDTMRRNKFYYLLNVDKPNNYQIDKALSVYCKAIKIDAINDIAKKKFDFDVWAKKVIDELKPLNISIKDEPRLRSQLETLAKISLYPKLLKDDLDSKELEPISELIKEYREELETKEKGFERAKFLFERIRKLLNYSKDSLLQQKSMTDFFPSIIFDKNIYDKYPRAYKFRLMILDGKFSVNKLSEEKFLSIMEKYFRIQKERNQTNHACADSGEFKTAKELREFISKAIEEIKEALPS